MTNKPYIQLLHNRWVRYVVVTFGILLAPLVGMQFADEVSWTIEDFIVAGSLLLAAGLLYELLASRSKSILKRTVIGAAVIAVLLYVWAELAVGILTDLGS
jgi:hypothetical protein